MPGSRIPRQTGAKAAAMWDTGAYAQSEIVNLLGLSKTAVSNICLGLHGWGKIREEPFFLRFSNEYRRSIEASCMMVGKQALERMEETLPDATLRDATIAFGVTFDKGRLIAGQPTEIHANLNVDAVQDLENLGDRLRKIIEGRKTKDVTNAQNEESAVVEARGVDNQNAEWDHPTQARGEPDTPEEKDTNTP